GRRVEPGPIVPLGEAGVELDGGRIRGVAWPGPVVALDQRSEIRGSHAGPWITSRTRTGAARIPEGKRASSRPSRARRGAAAGNPARGARLCRDSGNRARPALIPF